MRQLLGIQQVPVLDNSRQARTVDFCPPPARRLSFKRFPKKHPEMVHFRALRSAAPLKPMVGDVTTPATNLGVVWWAMPLILGHSMR